VTCTPYAKFWYIFEFPTPKLPIHYDTTSWLRWRLGGVYSWDLQCETRNRSKILSRPKLGNFWRLSGSEGHGFQKVAIFTPKITSLREPTSFEPFCVKIDRGVWLPGRSGKKNPESHRASHRKDMSPLTQGLNYRSACERYNIMRSDDLHWTDTLEPNISKRAGDRGLVTMVKVVTQLTLGLNISKRAGDRGLVTMEHQ